MENAETEFDSYIVRDFFDTYNEHYLKNYILYKSSFKEDIEYSDIISLLSNFLLHSKTEREESDRFYKKHHNFSDMLKTADNDQRYDAWVDSVFNARDEINHDRKSIIQITNRQNKNPNHPSWKSINEIKTPLADMTESQMQLFELISTLKKRSKNTDSKMERWNLCKIAKNLQHSLKTEVEAVDVCFSIKKRQVEPEYMHIIINKILFNLDYTSPNSIYGLIISYHDLWSTYQDQVGSPIYTILKEFRLHVDQIKLKNEHQQQILYAFLDNYHGKILRRDKDGKKGNFSDAGHGDRKNDA
ncbi:hypothetical protein FHR92_001041 [Fontibacillus solani]|uniref:Uncharacterized protein n=1 Tax=Fontibacillus solani TaxID=1572857 RepID=A0A7W3SR78_9BACL|nr:hypothetical protein [Fontibacillus solani]MBA9084584.1 hypothetical protein [Fontibacillus solani]